MLLELGHKRDEEVQLVAAVTIFPEYADRHFPSGVPVEVCHCSVCHPRCAPYIDGCPQVYSIEACQTRCFLSHPTVSCCQALIGFRKNNDGTCHVDHISGSPIFPSSQLTYEYLQNFPGAMYNTTVSSGDEACFLYRFTVCSLILCAPCRLQIVSMWTLITNLHICATAVKPRQGFTSLKDSILNETVPQA